jgi:endo-1,4-beta-xylanase
MKKQLEKICILIPKRKKKNHLILFFMLNSEVILLLLFYCVCNVIIHAQNPIGLKVSAFHRGLLLGSSAHIRYLRNIADDGQYSANLQRNYDLLVPEGEFMPLHIWMGEDQYNFTDTDWLLGATINTTGWAQKNYFRIRGHSLIWAYDMRIPRWLLDQESSITPDKAKSLLSDYIHAVVGRYRGKVESWIVINEAISDRNETRPFNLRDSFWFRKLGQDFIKYAFNFAYDADPTTNLLYNEYNIESGGIKAERTLTFINWLQSEKIPISGMGMQWHTNATQIVTPGDEHYQIAQRFIDQNISLIISELDVSIQMNGDESIDPDAIQKEAILYRSLLKYVLYFFPKLNTMITWGYADRYSWIPAHYNYTKGKGLPLDCQYQPKAAYWQLQEELARILVDNVYRISPESQPDKCLGTYINGTNTTVQLYSGTCNNTNQKWNVTWLGDGTYRFSPLSNNNTALNAYNSRASIGGVYIDNWTGDFDQEWAIDSQENHTYRVRPRNAWWRVLSIDNKTSNIVILNFTVDTSQQWILTNI